MNVLTIVSLSAAALILLVFLSIAGSRILLGLVVIHEAEVGIVIKKFAAKNLPPGEQIALHGEAGYQADLLSPGWHFGFFPWQYAIVKEPVVVVPQGEIALVMARAGRPIPSERILGRVVPCDQFQDARAFLTRGGEKGRQLGFLTAGSYRINTALFEIIRSGEAKKHGIADESLKVYRITPDQVGIVTTLDGMPIDDGEIAGHMVGDHDNFQDGQAFLDHGGRRGLQEQVLLSGSWNLNPWFVQVEQAPMTHIPIGYVGVVISFVGKPHEDVSGTDFKHGDLVNVGHKGVWVIPLYPGKHPLNTRIMRTELVPTTYIVLNWANRTEAHNYDARLSSITVRSKDGFSFNLDVSQIIHVGALEAPKVISRVGSMQNLVDHVLQPIVGNYFRNSAQHYTVLDFLSARGERQLESASHIREALALYEVHAIDTLVGDITPPAELMVTQTERKIAEEQQKTFEVQQEAQRQRQQLVRETALAEIQSEMVKSEQGVTISQMRANAKVMESKGEAEATRLHAAGASEAARLNGLGAAEAIRAVGEAKASAYRAGVEALGATSFTSIQLMQILGEQKVRVVPDILVSGNGGSQMTDAVLGLVLREQLGAAKPAPPAAT
jgi:uncharacterized membrane protein YqiK